jgi:hypothetical protein
MRTMRVRKTHRLLLAGLIALVLGTLPGAIQANAPINIDCEPPSWCPFDNWFCWMFAECHTVGGGGGGATDPTRLCRECMQWCEDQYAVCRGAAEGIAGYESCEVALESCETSCVSDFNC